MLINREPGLMGQDAPTAKAGSARRGLEAMTLPTRPQGDSISEKVDEFEKQYIY